MLESRTGEKEMDWKIILEKEDFWVISIELECKHLQD